MQKSNIQVCYHAIFRYGKCGKRPLRRWKTDIHGPMEKLSSFPQPANTVSHSSAPLTVYAHSHSAYCCEYPFCPILIEREKREQKKKRERHPRPKPKAALPLCYGKVFKITDLHPSNRRGTPTWEIIKATPEKAATGDFSARFQPLFPHFFERADW